MLTVVTKVYENILRIHVSFYESKSKEAILWVLTIAYATSFDVYVFLWEYSVISDIIFDEHISTNNVEPLKIFVECNS